MSYSQQLFGAQRTFAHPGHRAPNDPGRARGPLPLHRAGQWRLRGPPSLETVRSGLEPRFSETAPRFLTHRAL